MFRRPDQPTRRFTIRLSGLAVSVPSISQPCFLAVESNDRMTPNSAAPSSERKPPEIFCRSFIIRPSRSAWLLVNGTAGSDRKRSTSCLRVLRPDFDSTWIRGVDIRLRDKDIGAPGGNAVYLGAQARWRIGGGV